MMFHGDLIQSTVLNSMMNSISFLSINNKLNLENCMDEYNLIGGFLIKGSDKYNGMAI